jgi:hypothetical protein
MSLVGKMLALFLHSPSRSRKFSNSGSLITIILQILEILAIHLSLFFNVNKNVLKEIVF